MNLNAITLNVGGSLYQTSKETLIMHDNYFRALIITHNDMTPETILFIDRDPYLFRYILNWLRGVHILPEDTMSLKELIYEADYYCMEDLKDGINKKLQSSSTFIDELKTITKEISSISRDLKYAT